MTTTPDTDEGPAPDDGPMLSPQDVAAMLGGDITARTVRRYRRAWGLPSYKIGKHVRFREADVTALIARRPG